MNYLIHASALLAGCYVYYHLALRRETFFQLNRWLLLGGIAACFLLPLVTVPASLSLREVRQVAELGAFPIAETSVQIAPTSTPSHALIREEATGIKAPLAGQSSGASDRTAAFPTDILPAPAAQKTATPLLDAPRATWYAALDWKTACLWLYLAGVLILMLQFVWQVATIVRKGWSNPTVRVGELTIVELGEDHAPFSFWDRVFLNPAGYDAQTYDRIIEHERVHVRQRHSIDLVLAELLIVVQWFNPFAWLYRRAVENNLEYLTDAEVLRRGDDPVGYQLSLLRVAVPHHARGLVTNYNQHFLEKRITMMQSKRSSNRATWKYLALPLLLLLSLASLNGIAQTPADTDGNNPSDANPDATGNNPVDLVVHVQESHTVILDLDATLGQLQAAPEFSDPNSRKGATKRNLFSYLREKRSASGNGTVRLDLAAPDDNGREGTIKRMLLEFLREKGALDGPPPPPAPPGPPAPPAPPGPAPAAPGVPPPPPPAPEAPPAPPAPPHGLGLTDGRVNQRAWTAEVKEDEVCFNFMESGDRGAYRYNLTRCFDRSKVGALPGESIGEFTITRSAGTLTLRGSFQDDMGVGTFTFSPSAAFTNGLAEAGYRGYDDREVFLFFLSDFTVSTLAYAKREFDPSRDELLQMAVFDLNERTLAAVLADLDAAGYDRPDLQTILQLRIFNIDAGYVQALKDAGYRDLDLEDVIQAKIHGLTPDYISEMAELGYEDVDFEQIINMAIHNVDAKYVADLAEAGYTDVSADEVVASRIHNVQPEYVRAMSRAGLTDLTLEQAQNASIHGVDPDYVAELAALGFGKLSIDEVITAKIHGVNARKAKEMQDMGLDFNGIDDLTNYSIHGVTPDFVKGLRDLGYTDLRADDFVAARIHNITPAFVEGYADIGYDKIPFDVLQSLRIHDVSPAFIEKHRRDGDTLEDMIDYRIMRRSRR
ncbi:M56 family metallopeptidase [Lewinella sp. IMCC34191]|uniref:M56 family metallopeptidase n=1 Tax=Lewinella sp. IMCC34191 TaxID=2259172 RepID=UPI000E235B12|nr:M56 family metallopeptidase [Lewinella sp. IMCC34191]